MVEPGQHPSSKHPRARLSGDSFEERTEIFAILLIVHVLAFFLLLYGAGVLKKLVDMIPGQAQR